MSYQTAQKAKLAAFFQQHPDKALTVEELSTVLNGELAKSTLYRLITKLVQDGTVKRFVRGNSRQFVYQAVGCTHAHSHLHMKCTDCGKLYHLEDGASAAILQNILNTSDFAVDEAQTVLFGCCKDCKKETKS